MARSSYSPKILFICNSRIGVVGNIGFRVGKIVQFVYQRDNRIYTICRGGCCDGPYSSLRFFGHYARLLNAIRIYLFRNFKSRYYDLLIFEMFFFVSVRFIDLSGLKVAYLAESSPRIIRFLKRRGVRVVVDVPIAPAAYSRMLRKTGLLEELSDVSYLEEYEYQCYSVADRIIAPSRFVESQLKQLGISDSLIRTIPFGVDLGRNKLELDRFSREGPLKFCFLGNLSARKGINILLEAWALLDQVDVELHLCGRVSPEVKRAIKCHPKNNIICPGFVNAGKYLRECDVYVFPSVIEGSSKSIYEAMAAGLPVITTEESGSIVTDGEEGFIVPIFNSEVLVERMKYFCVNRYSVEVMGRKAFDKVSLFSWDAYEKKIFEALYVYV